MFRFEWLGLAVLVSLTVGMREPRRPAVDPRITACRIRDDGRQARFEQGVAVERASSLRLADAQYRKGESARAATTIRGTIAFSLYDHELTSLATLYAQFADESATIASPATSITDRFVAIRRAQALDMALGGAFADRLNVSMRTIAPEAAVAYTRAGDKAGAELATHTAAMFR